MVTKISSKAKRLVADALKIPLESITDDDGYSSIPEWDSLGQLKVVMAVERMTNLNVSEEEFETLSTIKGIINFLERQNENFRN